MGRKDACEEVKYSSICKAGQGKAELAGQVGRGIGVLGIGDDRSRVSARHRARQHASCAAPRSQGIAAGKTVVSMRTRSPVWARPDRMGEEAGEQDACLYQYVGAVGCASLVTEWHDRRQIVIAGDGSVGGVSHGYVSMYVVCMYVCMY
jgi:hypothetical protein